MKKSRGLVFTGERLIPEFNEGTAFYYEHLARYFFCCQFVKNKVVLDAGSGSGYGSYILAKQGNAKKVTGVDLSKKTVAYARINYGTDNNDFKVDDVEKLKTIKNNSIDVVVSFEVIEHLKNPGMFLSQVKRVIRKRGVVIISTPNRLTYPTGNKYHTKEFAPEEFSSLLVKFFKVVDIVPQNFRLSQEISIKSHDIFKLDSKTKNGLNLSKSDTAETIGDINDSEYLVALCSDVSFPSINSFSLSLDKVDHFNLTNGLVSLSKQFSDMHLYGKSLEATIKRLRSELNHDAGAENLDSKKLIEEINKNRAHIADLKKELKHFYTEYGEFIAKYSELFPNVYLTEVPTLAELVNMKYKKDETIHEPTFFKDFYYKVSSSKTYRVWQFLSKMRKKVKNKFK